MIHTYSAKKWDEAFSASSQQEAISQIETGGLLFFPELGFQLTPQETFFLSPQHADPQAKNISYDAKSHKLWGVQQLTDEQRIQLIHMMNRFSCYADQLIEALLPRYRPNLMKARTSFRPVQISGRKTSYRKDDKRLHIDAFPSAPNQGKRIFRVFCNVNPNGEDRVWRVGEPFEQVANRFLPVVSNPLVGKSALLQFLGITKSYRTLYDHYMLQIHDKMKADEQYQKEVSQKQICFPPNTTWIAQTDQVSHAVMKGQHVLEQTYYLPLEAMQNELLSPLRILERLTGEKLA